MSTGDLPTCTLMVRWRHLRPPAQAREHCPQRPQSPQTPSWQPLEAQDLGSEGPFPWPFEGPELRVAAGDLVHALLGLAGLSTSRHIEISMRLR